VKSIATFVPKHSAPTIIEAGQTLMDLSDAICEHTGKRYCVLCSSGSAALYLPLKALGIHELHIPASTFPAVQEACRLAGATDRVHDVDLATWQTQFPADARHVSPAHNYGCVADADLNRASRGSVIVDAAAAFLTPNAFALPGIYTVSFNWNKSISGAGGGCVLTDDIALADVCDGLKRHVGHGAFNFTMPALVAAEIYNQMEEIDARRSHLKELSLAYDMELSRYGLSGFPRGTCRWLTGTLLDDDAAAIRALDALRAAGYAPRPVWQPLASSRICPRAWEIHRRGIVLPGGFGITVEDVRRVCEIVGNCR
jgi:dTDP-4-amino-4,6-dideoxygalactose transaminase